MLQEAQYRAIREWIEETLPCSWVFSENFFVLQVLFNLRHKEWVYISKTKKKNVIVVVNVPVRENSIVWENEGGGGLWTGLKRESHVKGIRFHPGYRGCFQACERAHTILPA